ncbi:MAG: hypothetical protein Q7S44_02115 [bacterium]|nr:hypothetical protein [bacterium]
MKKINGYSKSLAKRFPQLKFALNKELDIWKVVEFFPDVNGSGGSNAQKMILEAHPALKDLKLLPEEERNNRLKQYIENFYEEHDGYLEGQIDLLNQKWEKVLSLFYTRADKVFKGLKWPEGQYIAFITISPPCPRFVDNKTFQITMNPEWEWIPIIAHEMLHFLFFEYVRKRYLPELGNTLEDKMNEKLVGKFIIPLWELSEVFNIVVLNSKDFPKEMGGKSRLYHGLDSYTKIVKSIWKEVDGDIDLFFSKVES